MPRPARILLVDDFADALDIYGTYLEAHGLIVDLAGSGAEALAAVDRARPDIVLLDLRMPGTSGSDVLPYLRARPGMHAVPIVAFTAHAFAAERDQALADGFDEVLAKPCLPDALLAFLERMLASSSPA